jgi:hypothetical protein
MTYLVSDAFIESYIDDAHLLAAVDQAVAPHAPRPIEALVAGLEAAAREGAGFRRIDAMLYWALPYWDKLMAERTAAKLGVALRLIVHGRTGKFVAAVYWPDREQRWRWTASGEKGV